MGKRACHEMIVLGKTAPWRKPYPLALFVVLVALALSGCGASAPATGPANAHGPSSSTNRPTAPAVTSTTPQRTSGLSYESRIVTACHAFRNALRGFGAPTSSTTPAPVARQHVHEVQSALAGLGQQLTRIEPPSPYARFHVLVITLVRGFSSSLDPLAAYLDHGGRPGTTTYQQAFLGALTHLGKLVPKDTTSLAIPPAWSEAGCGHASNHPVATAGASRTASASGTSTVSSTSSGGQTTERLTACFVNASGDEQVTVIVTGVSGPYVAAVDIYAANGQFETRLVPSASHSGSASDSSPSGPVGGGTFTCHLANVKAVVGDVQIYTDPVGGQPQPNGPTPPGINLASGRS